MKTSYEQVKEDVGNAWTEMGPVLLITIALYFWYITLPIAVFLGIVWGMQKMYANWNKSYKQKELERKRKMGYDV